VRGVKEYLKPCAYKESEPDLSGDGVLFAERTNELVAVGRLRPKRPEPQ